MTRPSMLTTLFQLLVVLALATPALAQPEKILDVPVGWTYRYGATTSEIAGDIAAGLRPFTIQRVGTGLYDVVTVQNTGPYAASGFGTGNMHYNRTPLQIALDVSGKRLVSLDCYEVSGSTRVTGISVPNGEGTVWGWQYDKTRQELIDWIATSSPPLRVLDLSIYTVGGQKRYAATAVANQGANAQSWWWYFDQTAQQVGALLQQHNARLIDIELETPGAVGSPARFAVVMVGQNPGAGWVYAGQGSSSVNNWVGQTGGRLTNLHRHAAIFGPDVYTISLVDNANPQTRRVRDLLAAAVTTGTYGFKLKQSGGPVLASLHENFLFEPASTLKIVHAAYAVLDCALGNRTLDGEIWVPNRCTSSYWNNVCPDQAYSCDSGTEPLSTTIRSMMRSSHNGRTRTIEELFGREVLNDWLAGVGLGDITINHTLGCLCGNPYNTMSANHIVSLYEKIGNGTFFATTWRDELFSLMTNLEDAGWSSGAFSGLNTIVNQEAAGTSLTAAEIAAFKSEMRFAYKSGGYGCDNQRWRSTAGWARIPFKLFQFGSWITVPRDYALTAFVHDGTDPGGAEAVYGFRYEILREQIRAALESWDDACSLGIAQQPSDVTVDEGDSAPFTVVAGGTGSATYQWYRVLAGGTMIDLQDTPGKYSGTTTATLTILNAVPADEGGYTCTISKICGFSFSDLGILTVIPSGTTNAPSALPTHLVMHPPAPNPFNPQVTLRFELPRATDLVVLEVFDVAGRRVRTIMASALPAGSHTLSWNGTDDGGRKLASGTYLARLRAGSEQATHRLMLVE